MARLFRSSRSRAVLFSCSLLIGATGAQYLHASSPDAWEEFAEDVRASCIAAAQGTMQVMRVEVDMYGSESYGFAVLFGFQPGEAKQRLLVCAYSKREQTAEISATFEL